MPTNYWDIPYWISQEAKLQSAVHYAYNHFELYRNRMDELNILPKDIKKISDIEKLPFLSKEDLNKFNFEEVVKSISKDITYIAFTSGTTSIPTPIYLSYRDFYEWSINKNVEAFLKMGLTKQDNVQIILGGLGVVVYVILEALRKIGATAIPLISIYSKEEIITRLIKFQVTTIFTFPSVAIEICNYFNEKNYENLSLKKIILIGESYSQDVRNLIEKTLEVEVFNIYGSTECGPIAMECLYHIGSHILPNWNIVEIIDVNTGKIVSQGEEGEIVITTLWKEALPLIRYRTGDIASMAERKCYCGYNTPILSDVKGRISDYIYIGPVKIHPNSIEKIIFDEFKTSLNIQLVVEKEDNKDKLNVLIEYSEKTKKDEVISASIIQRILNSNEEFEALIRDNTIKKPTVTFVKPDEIKMKNGKIKKVLDLRK